MDSILNKPSPVAFTNLMDNKCHADCGKLKEGFWHTIIAPQIFQYNTNHYNCNSDFFTAMVFQS
ncbi:MAG: hypothetical protein RIB79_02540 [Allomuricauda sp.]